MTEGAEGLQSPQPSRGEGTPVHNQETGQRQNAEARPENFSVWADKVKEEMRRQQQKHEWWLQEVMKNPEEAEQYRQLWENAEMLRDNLGKFSEDNPRIPPGDETKQKLEQLEQKGLAGSDEEWSNMSTHELSSILFFSTALVGGTLAGINYLTGGGNPGLLAESGLIAGTALGSSIEGAYLAKKGLEKLKALMRKIKEAGAEG